MLVQEILDAGAERPNAQPHQFGDLVPELGRVANELQHEIPAQGAQHGVIISFGHVIARRVVHDGQFPKDVSGVQERQDHFALPLHH